MESAVAAGTNAHMLKIKMIVKMALRFGWSGCARLRMSKLEFIGRALTTTRVASFGMGSSYSSR